MSIFPLDEILTTFKDLTSKALRVVTESKITGGYSPANLTMQNAVTANGNGTILNVNEFATAVLEVRGTFSATINFECSIDDTNWYSIVATKNDGTISSSCTTTGLYEIKVAVWKSIRARVSGYVSGNVTVVGKVSPLVNAEKSMQLTDSIPAGSSLIGKTQKYSKIQLDTLVNATSVVAGGNTGNILFGVTDEYEVWVLINIDQQPWTLNALRPWGGNVATVFYPSRLNVATAYASANTPAVSLFLGIDIGTAVGLGTPTSMAEAKGYHLPPKPDATFQVVNGSANLATITVRVLRIWR